MSFVAVVFAITLAPHTAVAVDDWAGRMLERLNEYRALNKREPFTLDPALMRAAMAHTHDMVENDVFSHEGSDGAGLRTRVERFEYPIRQVAENLAAGEESPEITVDRWMKNAGHRLNILNPRLRDAGIGYLCTPEDSGKVRYGHYWTLMLGRKMARSMRREKPSLLPLAPFAPEAIPAK
jgi:uncharacterized protein YkwD